MKKIKVDNTNNVILFWSQFRGQMPSVSAALEEHGSVVVSEAGWVAIQRIQGFTDGLGRTALVECE